MLAYQKEETRLPERLQALQLSSELHRDRVLGCWLGKNCGGTLGGPLEKAFSEEKPLDVAWYPVLKEGGMPNDDLEIQLIWLKALEEVGLDLKAADFAQYWLDHVGYNPDEYGVHKTNLRLGLLPPVSGHHNNLFADCMGCPIRSEIWACIAPGQPRVAVRFAYEDAICDHAGGESVYGEFFNVALQAAAFVVHDRDLLLDIGLSYLPEGAKTRAAVLAAISSYRAGDDWQEARRKVLAVARHPNSQYSPPNMAFQIIGWLYGREFGDSLCTAVNCGYDTDCTGATLGALLGIIGGMSGLPAKWTEPLGHTIATNEENGGVRLLSAQPNPVPATLQDLTDRVLAVSEKVLQRFGPPSGRIEDLYADASILALARKSPQVVPFASAALPAEIDYKSGPEIEAGRARKIGLTVRNPHPVPVSIVPRLHLPPGWHAPEIAGAMIPPHGRHAFELEVQAPRRNLIENSNRCFIEVNAKERPGQSALPLTLVGAPVYRVSAPFEAGSDDLVGMLDRAFEPETLTGSPLVPEGRKGLERIVTGSGYALPATELLASGGVTYLQSFVHSAHRRRIQIRVDANGPFQAWFNQAPIIRSDKNRSLRPLIWGAHETLPCGIHGGGLIAVVDVQEGWNEVLLKLVRGRASAPFQGYLVYTEPGPLFDGAVDLLWTRFPWDA